MPDVDLSFARYVAARKGAASATSREGAQYAYGGDLRVRSALDRLRPVTLAVEATLRFWQTVGRNKILGSSIRVSERQFPHIYKLFERCADTLQIPAPAAYVSPTQEIAAVQALALGSADDASVVLASGLIDALSEQELLFVIGRASGHIQNGHTVYLTALHMLSTAANMVVRYGSQPALLALNGWSRRAEITGDRAGLLCTRDLDVAIGVLVKLAVGTRMYTNMDVEEYLRQLEETQGGPSRFGELMSKYPFLPKRVKALRLFAQSTFYKSMIGGPAGAEKGGLAKEDVDAQVSQLLSVLR